MPAQSPTLSPTLSAMVAALRGSSSGMFFSTLPTRSAPTAAPLVKMPPPTLTNMARSPAPTPKPWTTLGAWSLYAGATTEAPAWPDRDRDAIHVLAALVRGEDFADQVGGHAERREGDHRNDDVQGEIAAREARGGACQKRLVEPGHCVLLDVGTP